MGARARPPRADTNNKSSCLMKQAQGWIWVICITQRAWIRRAKQK